MKQLIREPSEILHQLYEVQSLISVPTHLGIMKIRDVQLIFVQFINSPVGFRTLEVIYLMLLYQITRLTRPFPYIDRKLRYFNLLLNSRIVETADIRYQRWVFHPNYPHYSQWFQLQTKENSIILFHLEPNCDLIESVFLKFLISLGPGRIGSIRHLICGNNWNDWSIHMKF